ncbi:Pheromone-binding protein-related protein 2 [Gryllus bimaculatus]|nr:Pheromone-binding protein-related protein 2 [Gryllus bimaculatus]
MTLLVCVLQARRVPMWQRTVRSKAAECKNITNASDRDVAAVKSYYRHLSENAKCLLKCVYEQLGIIRDNHFIDQKEGLQLFHQYFAHDKMTLKLGMLVVGKCLARVTSFPKSKPQFLAQGYGDR